MSQRSKKRHGYTIILIESIISITWNCWSVVYLDTPAPTVKYRTTRVALKFYLLTWKMYATHHPSRVIFAPHMNIIHKICNDPQSGYGMRDGLTDGRTKWNQYTTQLRLCIMNDHGQKCSAVSGHSVHPWRRLGESSHLTKYPRRPQMLCLSCD